jgi:dynein assembly factor with WDR repeat domains 1
MGKCVETLRGHEDEVLDICFNSTGTRLVTASADGTGKIYNVHSGEQIASLLGIRFM